MQALYRKIFYVRSRENIPCPVCGGLLSVYGSRKRFLLDENGDRITLIIRRMKCTHCSRIHHELPDCIVPYKHYSSSVIEELLGAADHRDSCFPGESSEMYRLLAWFFLLRLYFEGVLRSLKLRWKEDLRIQSELNSLIPLSPVSLAPGWLSKLVRFVVNSGSWPQTHFA